MWKTATLFISDFRVVKKGRKTEDSEVKFNPIFLTSISDLEI